MKVVSASLLVFAGAIIIVGGGLIGLGDTHVMVIGCGVGLIGVWGWFTVFRRK